MDASKITLLFLRLPISLSFIGHGLVRIPKLAEFSNWMVDEMQESLFPDSLVSMMGYGIPILELLVGVFLLSGYRLRDGIFSGLALMCLLMVGSSSIENWSAVQSQLVHAIYLMVLFWYWSEKYKPHNSSQPISGFYPQTKDETQG